MFDLVQKVVIALLPLLQPTTQGEQDIPKTRLEPPVGRPLGLDRLPFLLRFDEVELALRQRPNGTASFLFTKPQHPPGAFDVALQLGKPAQFTGDRSAGGDQSVPFSQGTGEPVDRRPPVTNDRTLSTAPVIELIEQGPHTIRAPRTVGPISPPEACDEITPIACVAQLGCQRSPRLLVTVEHVGGGGREVVHVCPTFVDGLLPRDLG